MLAQVVERDAHLVAQRLIEETGSLASALSQPRERLMRIIPDAERAIALVTATRAAMLHALRDRALSGPVFKLGYDLLKYLQFDQADAATERLRVLFLDSAQRLLRDEVVSLGSLTDLPIFPREIVARALMLGASSMVIVHNHPSGDARPSRADREATQQLALACDALGIRLVGHLIVARSGVHRVEC